MMRFNLSELAVRERAITLFLIVAVIVSGVTTSSEKLTPWLKSMV